MLDRWCSSLLAYVRSVDSAIVIRRAGLADADGLAEVHVGSWRAAYDGLLPQELLDGLSVPRRADAWRDMIARGDGQTLVAVDASADRIVGLLNVGPSRDDDAGPEVGELRAIYLLPDRWNKGTGRLLHDAGFALLAPDFTVATLWVLDSNERAKAFYAKRGWQVDGATKWDERGDAILT